MKPDPDVGVRDVAERNAGRHPGLPDFRSPRGATEWHAGHRIALGIGLTLAYYAVFPAAVSSGSEAVVRAMMFPLGWVARWVNWRWRGSCWITWDDAVLVNGVFWGSLIAFAVKRRKK